MRICITADLHYDIARSRPSTERLAVRACRTGAEGASGDALVLVGDTAGAALEPLREALALFDTFPGRRLLVPGNHCLWCRPGETSLDRYERILPEIAAEAGFAVLDHAPVVVEGVGLVGSIGWYDYSLRDESLGIPEPFYRAKVAPGAAARLDEHRPLVAAHADELTPRHMAIAARWMDGANVRLGMSDEQFTAMLARKLAQQLDDLAPRVDHIVAFIHHLPFRELVPADRPDRFAFAAAFMGAASLGEVLRAHPKVTHIYCGHSHWHDRQTIDGRTVVNIGSTYTDKRLEVLDL
ncbi:MAG: metallophosphoesterase [Phycisphaerae bacterium]|nr:metallophosphoesterase [Phycisphaerae bacterium]